jgi:hypothetical protein
MKKTANLFLARERFTLLLTFCEREAKVSEAEWLYLLSLIPRLGEKELSAAALAEFPQSISEEIWEKGYQNKQERQ